MISYIQVQAHPEAPKKESCKSMIYGTLLFLSFQICSQFVAKNFIPFVIVAIFLQNPTHTILQRKGERPLSSSNVDKLKTSMGFQLATQLLGKMFWSLDIFHYLCTRKHQEQSPSGGLTNRAIGATVVSTMRKQQL